MPNEAQESQVLMAPVAPKGIVREANKSGSESPSVCTGKGQNVGRLDVFQRKPSGLSGGACEAGTMYAADDVASPVVQESNGHNWKPLREHDYIGLSDVSSSFQNVQRGETVLREELNLNLGATELRLGPLPNLESGRIAKGGEGGSSLKRSGSAAEIVAYCGPDDGEASSLRREVTTGRTEQQGASISSIGPAIDPSAVFSDRGAASADYRVAPLDQSFSSYSNGVHSTLEKEEPPSACDYAKPASSRSFPNTGMWHGERSREQGTDESLSLGIGLVPKRGNASDDAADKKIFHRSEGSTMEDNKQPQNGQQYVPPQHCQDVSFSNSRSWLERNQCDGVIQGDRSPASGISTEKTSMGRGYQPNSLERPKQELSMQDSDLPEMQGARGRVSDSVTTPGISAHMSVQGIHPSQVPQPDTRYPQEPRYRAENMLADLHRSGIVQEFMDRKHMLKMRQGGENGHFWLSNSDHHMPHSAQQEPLTGSRSVCPHSKNGVGGAKRGFSEVIGNSVLESRSAPYPDGRNGFADGGALREGSVGGSAANSGRSNGTEISQQQKHQLGAPPSPMYPCNPKPSPPSWQQSAEQSGGSFGPFHSQQQPARGLPLMSNRAEVSAVSGNLESNPKAWDSSQLKNLQEAAASSEISKHPSPDTGSAPVKDGVPATAPPRQSQVIGWPPVRNFRRQQPPRPVPQPTSTVSPPKPPVTGGTPSQTSLLVKVYMDGRPIGRKVNLTIHNSYNRLKSAIEDMFQQYIRQPGGPQSSTAGETGVSSSCGRKLNLLHSSEYVLTYTDHESDLMLVGDVPWEDFTSIVQRLRITKGDDIARRGGEIQ